MSLRSVRNGDLLCELHYTKYRFSGRRNREHPPSPAAGQRVPGEVRASSGATAGWRPGPGGRTRGRTRLTWLRRGPAGRRAQPRRRSHRTAPLSAALGWSGLCAPPRPAAPLLPLCCAAPRFIARGVATQPSSPAALPTHLPGRTPLTRLPPTSLPFPTPPRPVLWHARRRYGARRSASPRRQRGGARDRTGVCRRWASPCRAVAVQSRRPGTCGSLGGGRLPAQRWLRA